MFIRKKKFILGIFILTFGLSIIGCSNISPDLDKEVENITPLSLLKSTYPDWFKDAEISKTGICWTREDKLKMELTNGETISLDIDRDGQAFINQLKDFFDRYDYELNSDNSVDKLIYNYDDIYDHSLGFEKNDYKCILRWSDEFLGEYTINCADYSTSDEERFQELYSLAMAFSDDCWFVSKYTDDYILGHTKAIRGAYEWLAKKIDSDWRIIYQGQEPPSCSFLLENNIPSGFYEECFDNNKLIQYKDIN